MRQQARDEDLQKQVIEELDWTPDVSSTHIGVTVNDGAVLLGGEVTSLPERHRAERAAMRVHGVNVVANELLVTTDFAGLSDSDLAREAGAALDRDSCVPTQGVHARVTAGHITLTGTVQWRYQSDAADSAVRYLKGVTGISNTITIAQPATAVDIKALIMAALTESASAEAHNIEVTLRDGAVVLEGSVRTWVGRRLADSAAWSAPNVTSVRNRLLVQP